MSAKHLERLVSDYELGILDDELGASQDLESDMAWLQMFGQWERGMPAPEVLAEEQVKLGERIDKAQRWLAPFLLLAGIRARGEALARALGRLRDACHVALLELLESLERKPAPLLPPPLEAHSLSISAHGPPFGLASKAGRAELIT